MGKQKLQAQKVYCLGYAKGFSGRSRKEGKEGGVQGGHPLLKFTYMARGQFNKTFTHEFTSESSINIESENNSYNCTLHV